MTAYTPNLDQCLADLAHAVVRGCFRFDKNGTERGAEIENGYIEHARAELSALKARVEAAEGLLREVSEFIDTESRVVKAMAERAQQITGSIDAALQAAREGTS